MSSKYFCVRRYQFCAGHIVTGHESCCKGPHGHNYVVYFHAESTNLDQVGRVVDFSVLKQKLGGWIDTHWDHTTILWSGDKEAINALTTLTRYKPLFILPDNPTAENMAMFLLKEVCPQQLEGTDVRVTKVVLWETENCFVEATL